jgi:hypothetical protein
MYIGHNANGSARAPAALDASVKLATRALRCVIMTSASPLLSEADRQARPPETAGAGPVPMPGGVVSFFGSTTRGGDWQVPAHFRVVAIVGKVRLDLRRARFTSPITTIEAAVFAGHLEIGLPRGFRADYAGNSFGGKLEYHPESNGSLDPAAGDGSAPVVRVVGAHVAGAIDIYENPSWDSVLHRLRRAAEAFRG